MQKVMVFNEEDGKQLVKDYQQIIAHISPRDLTKDDKDMLERVEAVKPKEAILLSPEVFKDLLEWAEYALDHQYGKEARKTNDKLELLKTLL